MDRRALRVALFAAVSGYAGALGLGVIAPPSLSLDTLVSVVGRLPRGVLLVGGAALGLVTAGAVCGWRRVPG